MVLASLVLVAVSSCSSSNSPSRSVSSVEMESMFTALCDAVAQVRAGAVREARATFDDRAHESLHNVAAVVQDSDRAAAARLLEAKQVVEAKFAQLDPSIGPDLVELAARAGDAVSAAGGVRGKPCAT